MTVPAPRSLGVPASLSRKGAIPLALLAALTSPLAYLPMGADLKARLIHDRMESDRCALVEVLSKTWRTLADEGYEASPEQSCEVFANDLIDAGWHR